MLSYPFNIEECLYCANECVLDIPASVNFLVVLAFKAQIEFNRNWTNLNIKFPKAPDIGKNSLNIAVPILLFVLLIFCLIVPLEAKLHVLCMHSINGSETI